MKHPRPRPKALRRPFGRCASCGQCWPLGVPCAYCDPKAPLADKLVVARLRARQALGGEPQTGIDPRALEDVLMGRKAPTREELERLALAYRVPAKVFEVEG